MIEKRKKTIKPSPRQRGMSGLTTHYSLLITPSTDQPTVIN
ncbi:MAG: hypothetical protein AAFY16_04600 [Cyanobacteria bacterium J06642_3]